MMQRIFRKNKTLESQVGTCDIPVSFLGTVSFFSCFSSSSTAEYKSGYNYKVRQFVTLFHSISTKVREKTLLGGPFWEAHGIRSVFPVLLHKLRFFVEGKLLQFQNRIHLVAKPYSGCYCSMTFVPTLLRRKKTTSFRNICCIHRWQVLPFM